MGSAVNPLAAYLIQLGIQWIGNPRHAIYGCRQSNEERVDSPGQLQLPSCANPPSPCPYRSPSTIYCPTFHRAREPWTDHHSPVRIAAQALKCHARAPSSPAIEVLVRASSCRVAKATGTDATRPDRYSSHDGCCRLAPYPPGWPDPGWAVDEAHCRCCGCTVYRPQLIDQRSCRWRSSDRKSETKPLNEVHPKP